MRLYLKTGFSLLTAVAGALALATAANAGSTSFTVYHGWCGDWDANPVNASVIGQSQTPMLDGSIAHLVWGTQNGNIYVWARLTQGAEGQHIALAWKDDQNAALYQCGDSHGYSTATVWSGTSVTWTAGVPLTPPHARDATASCVGLLVWRSNGAIEYRATKCITPWIGGGQSPPRPSPAPTPPAPSPPASHGSPHAAIRVSLHGSRHSLENGQVLGLRGHVLGVSVGTLVELQARVGPRQWITFGVAVTRAGGRFSYAYRFTRTTGSQIYWLRARLPRESGHSSPPKLSRAIHVRVSG